MLSPSPLCVDASNDAIRTIATCISVLYGVNLDNVSNELMDSVKISIARRMPLLTIADLQEAYNSTKIIKRSYVSLSRDEVLEPLENYHRIKQQAISEVNKIYELENEITEGEATGEEFINKSRMMYLEALETGEFVGDMFNANAIVRDIDDMFSKNNLIELEKRTEEEFKRQTAEYETDIVKCRIPSRERIKALVFVKACAIRKYKFFKEIKIVIS